MSNLESIVPPLELCKQIPAGEFEGSVFAWRYPAYDERNRRLLNRWEVVEVNWYAVKEYKNKYDEREKFFPAPTVEEIITSLLTYGWLVKIDCRIQLDTLIEFYSKKQRQTEFGNTASETALRLWLKAKGIEVK